MTVYSGVHEKGTFSLSRLIREAKKHKKFSEAGAVGLFIGVVRGKTLMGEKVKQLTLEAYEEKANEVLAKICEDLSKRSGIIDVQIHHLVGEFNVGEDLVYVLVAGSHRKDVFPVLQDAVERYKIEAPVFKKEHIVDSNDSATQYWVSERDHQLK